VRVYIFLFSLVVLAFIGGCANASDGNDALVNDGHELRPLEPVAASTGDIYMPQSFGTKVTDGTESLVEFTVLTVIRVENDGSDYGWVVDYYYQLVLHIDDVLVDGTAWNWPSKGDEVTTIIHPDNPLEKGQSYLTFINPHQLDGRFISMINDDRIITAIPTGNYFREYDGYTVDQMRERAKEILINGYTPEWGEITGTCIVDGSDVLEAPEPITPDITFVEPGDSVVIEEPYGTEIIDGAWDLDLD